MRSANQIAGADAGEPCGFPSARRSVFVREGAAQLLCPAFEHLITMHRLKQSMRLWGLFIAVTIIGAAAAAAQQSDPATWHYGPYDKNIPRKLITDTNLSTAPPRGAVGGAILYAPPHTNSTKAVLLKHQTNSPQSNQIVTNRTARPHVAPKPKS